MSWLDHSCAPPSPRRVHFTVCGRSTARSGGTAGRMQKGEPSGNWLTWSGATGEPVERWARLGSGATSVNSFQRLLVGEPKPRDFTDFNREAGTVQKTPPAPSPRVRGHHSRAP